MPIYDHSAGFDAQLLRDWMHLHLPGWRRQHFTLPVAPQALWHIKRQDVATQLTSNPAPPPPSSITPSLMTTLAPPDAVTQHDVTQIMQAAQQADVAVTDVAIPASVSPSPSIAAGPTPATDTVATTLIPTFADEFNGTSLDTSKWGYNLPWSDGCGKNSDVNTEAVYYINPTCATTSALDANPYSVANGALDIAIKPTPADVSGAAVNNKPLVTGYLNTAASMSQTYGYFEMRAQLPATKGLGGSFWMIPKDGSWPPELDIQENLGEDPTTVYQTVHDLTSQQQAPVKVADGVTGWHTYAADWEPDKTTFYVDGKVTQSFATPAAMNKPMYMILAPNATPADHTNWGSPVDATTQIPADFKIDYVRAYATNPVLK